MTLHSEGTNTVGLRELRLLNATMKQIMSTSKVPCSRKAKELLQDSMMVSAMFLFTCGERACCGEDDTKEYTAIIENLLLKLGIEKTTA